MSAPNPATPFEQLIPLDPTDVCPECGMPLMVDWDPDSNEWIATCPQGCWPDGEEGDPTP